jgi:hypothetical protein
MTRGETGAGCEEVLFKLPDKGQTKLRDYEIYILFDVVVQILAFTFLKSTDHLHIFLYQT